jgi:starch synthase (maltosyl-transferring)
MYEKNFNCRAIIEHVSPEIDCGRFPIKRVIGEQVFVGADVFTDGHKVISVKVLHRREFDSRWIEVPMIPLGNDRWQAAFTVNELGCYHYTITAWINRFKSWQQDLEKKVQVDQDVSIDLLIGAQLVNDASQRAPSTDAKALLRFCNKLSSLKATDNEKTEIALSDKLTALMDKYEDRSLATIYSKELSLVVDREKARFSTWYEMFPRSCSSKSGQHGTFKDCEAWLPYIADMGFDVLYIPPIHPIGRTHRKGKNNSPEAGRNDPGTPWAIGSDEGAHKSIHPQLGTLEDFNSLIVKAKGYGIEIAMDIAFQCSPDHPYVKEHPEWFLQRPDGTIQYAENPPKKYQDTYPLYFENDNWQELWEELKSVFIFWIAQGIRIFRVDNPHTKPFQFWEWVIKEVKEAYPDVIFLSEAFTRPKIMYHLAKLGFTQSYTYFTWRNTKWEFVEYLTELTQTDLSEYFRPNFWTNTPDILTEYLQNGGHPAFIVRLVLAATMTASYGIYGPAFELQENKPREKGSEEYLNSEKYEIRYWDIERADSLRDFITCVNRIRQNSPALQTNLNLRFHKIDNEQMICFSKRTDDLSNIILVVVNLDSRNTQSGWVELPISEFNLTEKQPYYVVDLLNDIQYKWQGPRNYVELNPSHCPAHIFKVISEI